MCMECVYGMYSMSCVYNMRKVCRAEKCGGEDGGMRERGGGGGGGEACRHYTVMYRVNSRTDLALKFIWQSSLIFSIG
jgi:hypothetical protein